MPAEHPVMFFSDFGSLAPVYGILGNYCQATQEKLCEERAAGPRKGQERCGWLASGGFSGRTAWEDRPTQSPLVAEIKTRSGRPWTEVKAGSGRPGAGTRPLSPRRCPPV